MNIDYERLRDDLKDYFGAGIGVLPVLIMDVIRVENASEDELIQIARENGFNLSNYERYKTF